MFLCNEKYEKYSKKLKDSGILWGGQGEDGEGEGGRSVT